MSDINISSKDVFNQLISSSSQMDSDQNVLSISPQNLDQLESMLKTQGINVPASSGQSEQARLQSVMTALEQSGVQISQTAKPDGTLIYSIDLSPDTKVGAAGMQSAISDQLQIADTTATSPQSQAVSASLSGVPAAPSPSFENPYLTPGSSAILKQIFEALFAKKREIQQLVGETGIQQMQMAIQNTAAKVQTIDSKYNAENLKESANINYNTTMMAVTGMAGVTGTIAANKQMYHNQRAETAGTESSSQQSALDKHRSKLTLTPEGSEEPVKSSSPGVDRASETRKAAQAGLLRDNINTTASTADHFARSMQAGTNMAANTQESQAAQAEAEIDLNQQLVDRNLKATTQQQQDLNADGGKLLDMIKQFSEASKQMTESTFRG